MPSPREGGRARGDEKPQRPNLPAVEFINPYPWMSSVEAMVHISLEEHQVPFTWRYFDGVAPDFTALLANQGYQPEFTLKEYNTVILVQGGFYGTLPGVLDKVALAKVTFEADGWKVIILWDTDIRREGAWNLLVKEMPNIGSIKGPPHQNPYGHPDLLARLKLRRPHRAWRGSTEPVYLEKKRSEGGVRRRRKRSASRGSDSGRTRSGKLGRVSGAWKAR